MSRTTKGGPGAPAGGQPPAAPGQPPSCAAPEADETCTLTRTVVRDGLRLEVWTCTAPAPRPPGEVRPGQPFTVGVFRRGETVPARDIWPGSVEGWSCNTGIFPGHLDLVLYLGGEAEAERTRAAIAAAWARRELQRLQAEQAEAARVPQVAVPSPRAATPRPAARPRSRAKTQAGAAQPAKARTGGTEALSQATATKDQPPYALEERLKKTFTLRIGRRKRRIFYVSPEEARREDAGLSEAGWYVNTVRPPASWMNNDPFGPYRTIRALLRDADSAYSCEEE